MIVDLDYEIVYQGRPYGPGRDIEMPDDCVALTILRKPAAVREIAPRGHADSPAPEEALAYRAERQPLPV